MVDASLAAGARNVELIEEPIAAAWGAGLDISEPAGKMVVDVGGGTSEVALLSIDGIVVSNSMRMGGHTLDETIIAHVKAEHKVARVPPSRSSSASAPPTLPSLIAPAEIRGRGLVSGMPREVTLASDELRGALEPTVAAIIERIKETLDRTPPDLASDVAVHGILPAGGGALLGGFGERVHSETGMPVRPADSPLTCVVTGAGEALAEAGNKKRSTKTHPRVGPGVRHMAASSRTR